MNNTSNNMASPAVQNTLQRWHEMVATRDMSVLEQILAEDVVFYSPVAFNPYPGKAVVSFILQNVIQVFENFTYHRSFVSDDGHNVVLEFSANIGEAKLKGIDMIRFDADGQIVEFEVMIRPKRGLEALAAQMGERIKAFQPQ